MSTLAETKYEIDGHTVSFAISGTGVNPWSQHYATEHKIPQLSLNVCRDYVLIDGEYIYCVMRSHDWMSLRELVTLDGLKWTDFIEFFNSCYVTDEGKLSEKIASLNEFQERCKNGEE